MLIQSARIEIFGNKFSAAGISPDPKNATKVFSAQPPSQPALLRTLLS